jgi:putative ABC transport system permease protein
MFIVKNALKSINGAKGRNIIIAVIILTIVTAATLALAINNSASYAKQTGLSDTKITAAVEVNRTTMMQAPETSGSATEGGSGSESSQTDRQARMQEMLAKENELTLSKYQEWEKDSTVPISSYYSDSINVAQSSSNLKPIENSSTDNAPQGGGGGFSMSGSQSDFMITGLSSDEAVEALSNFSIKDGKVFGYDDSDVNQAVISETLATYNNLKVSDTVTVQNPDKASETYKFKIVGICEDTQSSSSGGFGMMGADPANTIYVNYKTVANMIANSKKNPATLDTDTNPTKTTSALAGSLSYTYVLGSKQDYDQFASDLKTAGLDDSFQVTSPDVEAYEASLVPLENLSTFATTLFWIILGVGAIVLIALSIFNIRERKYEIGVLTAIGVKKPKVAAQFAVELLIVTLFAVVIGGGIGAATSVPVSNAMLKAQISSEQSKETSERSAFGRDRMGGAGAPGEGGAPAVAGGGGPSTIGRAGSSQSFTEQVNAVVTPTILFELLAIGLALSILGSLVGVVFVSRYEPLQILADR